MPYQNRLDPWGKLNAVNARGNFMGNRGVLHNEKKEIITTHKIKGWVTCLLDFKDRKRKIMTPRRYTELFFLDEATAFAAGHRPCAECRRKRYNEFKEIWLRVNGHLLGVQKTTVANIDKILQEERIHKKEKVTYMAKLNSLPDGTMIDIASKAYLIWKNKLFLWSFSGYTLADIKIEKNAEVQVLTPKSYVNIFSAGFVPGVYGSV